jgi:galactose mutarotase-like enzyme
VSGTGTAHGSFAAVDLQNELIRAVAVPGLGGRVVSLVDRRSGRDWLVPGEPPATAADWSAGDAAFLGRQAYGWDECLPTVAPCPDPLHPSGPALRDHGDGWGRLAPTRLDGTALVTELEGAVWPYRLVRRLRPEGAVLHAAYELTNGGGETLPVLWSMHSLLALEPGSRLHAPGIATMWSTFHAGAGLPAAPTDVAWPLATLDDGRTLDLAEVRAAEAGMAAKLYARLPHDSEGRAAAATPDGSWIGFRWDAASAPVLGLWLDFGGWPAGDPHHQVAIEPTTSEDDDLASAIAGGRALTLAPGVTRRWWVRVELGPPGDRAGLDAFLGGPTG